MAGFKIIDELNRGAFGRVERVKLSDGTIAARKVFDPVPQVLTPDVDLAKLKKRFRREVKVQSSLDSTFVLPIMESDLDADPPWFLMALADMNYMSQIQSDRAAGMITPKPLVDILGGLEELHRLGFTHRDLKPQNVLLHDDTWKLSDFGLVLSPRGTTTKLTSVDSSWGTPEYAAPEQAHEFGNVTAAADIYAFGCILHDLVSGSTRIPYQRQTAPGPLGFIIEKCTETLPQKRFKSVAGLRTALLKVLSSPVHVAPTAEATEWQTALNDVTSWTPEKLTQFIEFLARNNSHQVFDALSEEVLTALAAVDPSWEGIVGPYCEWARGGFPYEYCDVLIERLEVIFGLGAIASKAGVVLAAAELGASHNRWFVMRRLMQMCGPRLDEPVARRIAIEILAEEEQSNFIRCAERINHGVNDYHPEIAAVLSES